MTNSWQRSSAVAVALAMLAMLLYWPMFQIRPMVDDNLYPLAWAETASWRSVVAGDAWYYPEWRPLAQVLFRLEHGLIQMRAIPAHYAVNLALWVLCAALVFRLVALLSGSALAAILASVVLLTDLRSLWALILIVEQQTTLACVFGLLALLIVIRADARCLSGGEVATAAALLLASALSKEYGLAFAMAVGGSAVLRRRSDLAWAGLGASVAYTALRFAIAGGAVAPYCERMFFFFEERHLCIAPMQGEGLAQMIYNASATAINLVGQGLLSEEGQPVFARRRLLASAVLVVPMAVALARGSASVVLLALVMGANAALSLVMYHERNQLVGVCAMAVLVGIGVAALQQRLGDRPARHVVVAGLVAVILLQGDLSRRLVAAHAMDADHNDPCETELYRTRDFARPFIHGVKLRYGLPDPYCLGS